MLKASDICNFIIKRVYGSRQNLLISDGSLTSNKGHLHMKKMSLRRMKMKITLHNLSQITALSQTEI